jgi:hypothetical protein
MPPITGAEYARKVVNTIAADTTSLLCYPAYSSVASDTVIVDDHSLKTILNASKYALWKSAPDVVVKAKIAVNIDGTFIGLVLRADTQTDPQTSIEILCRERYNNTAQLDISAVKKVNGAPSLSQAVATVSKVADAWIEAQADGETIKIYYNGTQVGTDLTIADGITNTYHGLISGGGNSVQSFFAGAA